MVGIVADLNYGSIMRDVSEPSFELVTEVVSSWISV